MVPVATSTDSIATTSQTIVATTSQPVVATTTTPAFPPSLPGEPTTPAVPDALLPHIASTTPSEVIVGTNTTLTLFGSNFSPTNMVVMREGTQLFYTSPTSVSPDGTSLTFVFPDRAISTGLYALWVYDHGKYLPTSLAFLKVTDPRTEHIDAINPAAAKAGDTVTISGSNFFSDSYVELGANFFLGTSDKIITPTERTQTSLQFIVPPGLVSGTYQIFVGGASGQRISNNLSFTITSP